jgi:signal transduction histidine kinase
MDRPLISRRQERKQKSYLQRDICLALVSHELRTPTNAIVEIDNYLRSAKRATNS